jgi:hypothetical protein
MEKPTTPTSLHETKRVTRKKRGADPLLKSRPTTRKRTKKTPEIHLPVDPSEFINKGQNFSEGGSIPIEQPGTNEPIIPIEDLSGGFLQKGKSVLDLDDNAPKKEQKEVEAQNKMPAKEAKEIRNESGTLLSREFPNGEQIHYYEDGSILAHYDKEGNLMPLNSEGPTPTQPEPKKPESEKEIKEEIENLSEKDRKGLGVWIGTLGFKVKSGSSLLLANSLNLGIKKAKVNEKGTAGRFFTSLRDSYLKDSAEAEKEILSIQKGDSKFAKTRSVGMLAGSIIKIGRTVADVTGASIANPFRYAMMGGMVTARVSEAGKEARFKNEELLEKTRIQDADKAAEEAWKIYEQAKKEAGNNNVSTEDLRKAYLTRMPVDLSERLEKDPSVALGFIQKILRKQLSSFISELNYKIMEIEDSFEDETEKKSKIEKLLKKGEKKLKDYDRMLTQYGTVDQIAMTARLAQKAGKLIVLGMQIETAVISLEHMFTGLSHLISNHNIPSSTNHETIEQAKEHLKRIKELARNKTSMGIEHPVVNDRIEEVPMQNLDLQGHAIMPEQLGETPETSVTLDQHGFISGIKHLQTEYLKHLQEKNIDPAKAPAWTHEDPTKLARELGGYKPGAVDGKESLLVGKGSTLSLDSHGNLLLHDTLNPKNDMQLINGDTSQVEQYHGTMFHAGHHDVSNTPASGAVTEKFDPSHPFGTTDKMVVKGDTEYYYDKDGKLLGTQPFHNSYDKMDLETREPLKPLRIHTVRPPETAHTAPAEEEIRRNLVEKMPNTPRPQPQPTGRLVNGNGYGVGGGTSGNGYGVGGGVYGEGVSGYNARTLAEYGYNHPVFSGATEAQGNYLMEHVGLIGNKDIYKLGAHNLVLICEKSNENMKFFFGNDSANVSIALKSIKASAILNNSNSINNISGAEHLKQYFEVLKNFSGLKPEGGLFRRNETAEHYMGRALEKLMAEGKLDDFEASIRK